MAERADEFIEVQSDEPDLQVEEQAVETEPQAEEVEDAPQEERRKPLPPEEYESRIGNLTRGLRSQERENRRMAERLERMDEMFQRMAQRQYEPRQQGPAPEQMPDPEQDPIGTIRYLMQERERLMQREQQQQAQEQQYTNQARQFEQLTRNVVELEEDFKQDTPDYNDVVDPFLGHRVQTLMEFGMSQDQAANQVRAEIAALSQNALRNRRNPAEAVYRAAKQLGFGRRQQHPNSLANLKNGQRMARSISGGGKTAGGPVSLKELSQVKSDDDFMRQLEAMERRVIGN